MYRDVPAQTHPLARVATPFYLHTVQPSYFSIHRHQTVPNAFMAAPPRHPFFAQLILGLERSRNARFKSPGHPLAATGPIYTSPIASSAG